MKREKRKEKLKHKKDLAANKKWEQFDRVFESISIKKDFSKLQRSLKEQVISRRYPSFRIELSDELKNDSESILVAKEVDDCIKQLTFVLKPFNTTIKINDYFSVAVSVAHCFKNCEELSSLENIKTATSLLLSEENIAAVIKCLYQNIDAVLIEHNKMDRFFFWASIECNTLPNGKPIRLIRIHRQQCMSKSFFVDGQQRIAYKCGQCFMPYGIKWAGLDNKNVGLTGLEKNIPVYIQSHALERLYERIDCFENSKSLIYDYLWCSILNAKVVKSTNGKYLIEYWFNCHKLGYLVTTINDGVAIVRTFLFITMDGTPEGLLLHKKLGIRRDDKEYLHLDKLRTYLMTDIQEDTELRNVFEECGCGHLFKVVKEDAVICRTTGDAKDIRKYLNLGS